MTKRAHSEMSPDWREGSSKRRVAEISEDDALEVVRNHAKDLAEALQALEASTSREPAIQRLRGLSTTVLPALERLTERRTTQEPFFQVAGQQPKRCTAVTSPTTLPPFKLEDIPSELPPLPNVGDSTLEKAAFTHSGAAKGSSLNYERLEWLGDAYSEVISSALLFRTFEKLPAGRLSQLRELLIKNTTLGGLAKKYGLLEKAILPVEVRDSKERMKKVPGDIMEAYIAAVILADPEEGIQRIGKWLRDVFSMTIKDQIKSLAKTESHQAVTRGPDSTITPQPDIEPKVLLQNLIGVPGVRLRYEDNQAGPKSDKYNKKLKAFSVNLFMDGWGVTNMRLGWGTGLSKKDAGKNAALMALNNSSFIKKYADKKAALEAAQAE